jgi:hypothetical protein
MASFIFVFFQNAPSLYFFLSQESIGDIDIMVSPQPHYGIEDETTRHFEEPLLSNGELKPAYTYQ